MLIDALGLSRPRRAKENEVETLAASDGSAAPLKRHRHALSGNPADRLQLLSPFPSAHRMSVPEAESSVTLAGQPTSLGKSARYEIMV